MVARVIEQSDVDAVCNDMINRGEKPATTAVLKILGRGSPNTIQKFIKVWRENNASSETEIPTNIELPEDFKESLESFGRKLFNAAEQEMQATIQRIQVEKEEAIAKIQAEMQDINEASELLADDKADLEERLEESHKKNNELIEDLHELEKELTEHKAISETKISEALAIINNDKAIINELEVKNRDLEVKNSKQEAEIERLTALLTDKDKVFTDSQTRLVKSEKALSDTQAKLTETQTELKVMTATAQEKDKNTLALKEQLDTLKTFIEKMEVKPKPAPRKKVVSKKNKASDV